MFWIYGRAVRIITFGFGDGICLFPFIFLYQPAAPISRQHELIHARQQLEVLLVCLPFIGVGAWLHSLWWLLALLINPFYLWYGVEYLVRWIIARDSLLAYYSISFEQEAYAYENEPDYLLFRRPFAWVPFLQFMRHWPFPRG